MAEFVIDGGSAESVSITSSSLYDTSSTDNARISTNAGANGDWFNGTVDEVLVYNRALSVPELQVLYDDIGGPPEVVDVNASASLDGDRAVNDVIDIIVTFSDPVTVNTGGGTPRLLLETGMTDKYADYLSGTGTDTLTFRYTVQAGDSFLDLDYKATDSLELNGGTIRDTGDTIDANLTLPVPGNTGSLGFNRDIVFSDLPWYNGAWGYRIKITIDSTKVTGDLSDFPYLIHIASNAGLRDNARADGYDLLFTGDDKVTKLEHEIEEFVSGKESWHMGEDTLLEQQC